MKIRLTCFSLCILFLISGCKDDILVKDTDYLNYITDQFAKTESIALNRAGALFSPFADSLSNNEELALKFLFAAMPLNDLADYSGDFFLANVKMSLKAREQYPWLKDLPDDIFLHYVLPIRVNNENLDSFRIKYYDELYERVGQITEMEQAALEINHWCHEKVSYQSADIRTSAPGSTILSARGRCGEESTFTVAALRTVGIPARQVYVPRWAHSDDNHAWVEVWINGLWKYLGACEPEAVLNRGWFTESASRAMLVRTYTFGKYFGNEDLVRSTENFAEINNLKLYSDINTLHIQVINDKGDAVNNANLSFLQYNYSELSPLSTVKTDNKGACSFNTAAGDLVLWASKDSKYSYVKVSVSDTDSVIITIDKPDIVASISWDLVGPDVVRANPAVSEDLSNENKKRLKIEDSIRQSYISSWIDNNEIRKFAELNNFDTDDITTLLKASMGNYSEILSFLLMTDKSNRDDALSLLNVITSKDLRDTRAEVLYDHLIYSGKFYASEFSKEIFVQYVLNPRIDNEIIRPWRKYIQDQQNNETIEAFRQDPSLLSDWMNNYLPIRNELNYYNVPLTPVGVLELGLSDQHSRDILFVACCRACGIPARLEPGTLYPQYMKSDKWEDVFFKDRGEVLPRSAKLQFVSDRSKPEPQYYKHFTIAKIENGSFRTLEYDYNRKVSEFEEPLLLSPGSYMLVTGNRLDDKNILCSLEFFSLEDGDNLRLEVSYRENEKKIVSIGKLSGDGFKDATDKLLYSKDIAAKGAVIAWIDPEKEPSKHLLNEIQTFSSDFNKWNGKVVFVSDPKHLSESFDTGNYPDIPQNAIFAYDRNLLYLNKLFGEPQIDISELPLVIYVNKQLEIIYKSTGYKVGYAEQLLKLCR